jgi:hypothetical protein
VPKEGFYCFLTGINKGTSIGPIVKRALVRGRRKSNNECLLDLSISTRIGRYAVSRKSRRAIGMVEA